MVSTLRGLPTALAIFALMMFGYSAIPIDAEATWERRMSSGERGDATEARVVCQMAVRTTLLDPRSAEWGDLRAWPVSMAGNNATVQATYRAANAFGGTVPGSAECMVMRVGDRWQVVGLSR